MPHSFFNFGVRITGAIFFLLMSFIVQPNFKPSYVLHLIVAFCSFSSYSVDIEVLFSLFFWHYCLRSKTFIVHQVITFLFIAVSLLRWEQSKFQINFLTLFKQLTFQLTVSIGFPNKYNMTVAKHTVSELFLDQTKQHVF